MNRKEQFEPHKDSHEKLSSKEKLDKILTLARELWLLFLARKGIDGTENYTLIGDPVGYSSAENTPMASVQLEFALAMSLDPKVKDLAESDRKQKEIIRAKMKNIIESRVLHGLKFLDLGSGCKPTFARVARAAGADVYTVDVIGSEEFEYEDTTNIDSAVLETEKDKHIQVDLNDPNALETISKLSGGEFDLVTSAHLATGWGGYAFTNGKEIAQPLLRSGGIYFDANSFVFAGNFGEGGAEVKKE